MAGPRWMRAQIAAVGGLYAQKKALIVQTVGMEDGGIHGVLTFEDIDWPKLVDHQLGLARDDYLCIPGAAAHFHPACQDNACRVSGPLADALHEVGLAQAEPGQPPQRLPATPSGSILHDAPAALRLSDVAPLVAAALSVRRAERREGIASQLSVVGRARRREDPAAARRAAGALWRIQPWLPFDGECLQRSMLLVAFLRELGLTADWVFGVRLWPFSAHCWVQSGDVCLNDDHERLRAYTPILCR